MATFYPQWNPSAYYITNNVVSYLSVLYQAQQNSHNIVPVGNPTFWSVYTPPSASAVGPTGAVQYTDGLGAFQGVSGLFFDGVGSLSTNNVNLTDINGEPFVTALNVITTWSEYPAIETIKCKDGSFPAVGIDSAQYLSLVSSTAAPTTLTTDGTDLYWSGTQLGYASGGGGNATGPTGSIQYSDGSGGFLGNTGLQYDGVASLYNTSAANYINFANAGDFTFAGGNRLSIQGTNNVQVASQTANVFIDSVGGDGVYVGNNGGVSTLFTNKIAPLSKVTGISGQFLGVAGSGNIEWQAVPAGPTGPPGPTGPAGANGQSSSYFNYRADNAAIPTTGHISWSNFASQISSTYIRVSHINQNGDDIDIFLNLVQQGNTLIIQDANVSANFQTWLVSGTPIPNTGSGYVQYPVTLTSSGGSTNFANSHQIILATITPGPAGPTGPPGPMDAGLQSRLQIVPTLSGQLISAVSYTGPTGVGSPSSWVPDAGSALPLTGGTLDGWRNFKQVGTSGTSTKVSWFPYNPYFGASLPYTVNPSPTILKKDLQSVWAIITTKNRISTQGQIFFNIFTYDVANPPTTPLNTFTNRFDYVIGTYPTMYGTGVTTSQTLNGGFRYLICAVDSPKIVQQTTANRTVTLLLNDLVSGRTYTIGTVGTGVNWVAMGAAVATVGCVFVYNGVAATGTLGVATEEVSTSILVGNLQTPTQTTFLRDPYDIHTDIPHVQFNAVVGASNTPQPADIANVAVSAICISSTSGTVTPTLDWTVEKIGFSANNGAVNYEYTLTY